MWKKVLILISGLIIISGGVIILPYYYENSVSHLNQECTKLFKDASEIYFDEKFHELDLNTVIHRSTDSKINEHQVVVVSDEQSIVLIDEELDSLTISDAIEERRNEYIVMHEGRFSVDSLHKKWNSLLSAEHIICDNALRVTNLKTESKEVFQAYTDSTVCNASNALTELYGGWVYDFKVEPFIRYTIFTVIRKDYRISWLIAGWVVAVIFFIILFRKYGKKEEQPVENSSCSVFNEFNYDEPTDSLLWKGERMTFRSQLHVLFVLLLKSPHHCISREELTQTFWTKKEFVKDDIRQLISHARKALKDKNIPLTINRTNSRFCLEEMNVSCDNSIV